MNATTELEGSAALTHWGVIRARGADAAPFLHGQLTNDVQGLEIGRARMAGFCSAKGRLQASFVVWRTGPEEILLACSRSVLPAVLKRLSMFVMRAKCTLSDASGELTIHGLAGAPARAVASALAPWQCIEAAGATVMRLPDVEGTARAWQVGGTVPAASSLPLEQWRWLEVCSGVPVIESGTVEAFVPQMINFELIGGVDFKKGCYPGQEVVARSQYRGTIKRRMALFDVDAAASAGQEIFHSGDPAQPAGMVVNAAPRPDGGGSSLLVEVKLATLSEGSLHLAGIDGPALVRRPLPYVVPVETAEAA
jgi:tRNA-modifying protein YgfZ